MLVVNFAISLQHIYTVNSAIRPPWLESEFAQTNPLKPNQIVLHSLLISEARRGFDQQMKEIYLTKKKKVAMSRCGIVTAVFLCRMDHLLSSYISCQRSALNQTFILSLLVSHCWWYPAKWHQKQLNLHDATWWSLTGL